MKTLAQQILKHIDNNLKSISLLFKHKHSSNLVYDSQAFQIKDEVIILDTDLEIKLPKQLIGKNIKQVEIISKLKQIEVVFSYEPNETNFSRVKPNDKIISINLGFKNLASCTKNSMMWFFLMNKATTRQQFLLSF